MRAGGRLALQTLRVLQKLTGRGKANKKGASVKVMALLGTPTLRLETELHRRPPDVAVGTPATIAQLLLGRKLRLSPAARGRTIVLDEVGALTKWPAWMNVRRLLFGHDTSHDMSHDTRPAEAGAARSLEQAVLDRRGAS